MSTGTEEMHVGQVDWHSKFGDEADPKSDWSVMNQHATFKHQNAAEFILFIGDLEGDDAQCFGTWYQHWKDLGLSEDALAVIENAQRQKFEFICFYG